MADNQEVAIGKWEKFENELDNNDANQGQEFNQFIESRKNSTDNTSIFTSSGNQDRYKEFSRLDQESGYKGWSIDIRGKKRYSQVPNKRVGPNKLVGSKYSRLR